MANKVSVTAKKIRAFMDLNPHMKPRHIAITLNVPVVQVYNVRAKAKADEVKAKQKTLRTTYDSYFRAREGRRIRNSIPANGFKGYWEKFLGWFA